MCRGALMPLPHASETSQERLRNPPAQSFYGLGRSVIKVKVVNQILFRPAPTRGANPLKKSEEATQKHIFCSEASQKPF